MAQIQSLVWEPPYAVGPARNIGKKKKLFANICLMTRSVGYVSTGLSFPICRGQNSTQGVKGLCVFLEVGSEFYFPPSPHEAEKGLGECVPAGGGEQTQDSLPETQSSLRAVQTLGSQGGTKPASRHPRCDGMRVLWAGGSLVRFQGAALDQAGGWYWHCHGQPGGPS